jgi:hypothetical protein
MGTIKMQNACSSLWDMQEEPDYKALADTADGEFNAFRQRVDHVGMRCLAVLPSEEATEEEIRELLEELQEFSMGKLARFGPFIDEALQAL